MNRHAKIVCVSLLLVPSMGIAQSNTMTGANVPRAETVIYKHVDESGRVTYANSPIKGGARIALEPLTVIPSTPSGSLNPANAQVVSRQASSVMPPAMTTPSSPAKPAMQIASVPSLSNQAPMQPAKSIAPDNSVVASLQTMTQLTQQRQAETKKRLLEGELQTEERLLNAAKSKLEEEQKSSGNVRAMRASFAATNEAVTAQKPLISPEVRAEIERHFERVRNLQDQVAMHENHLHALRDQLGALK